MGLESQRIDQAGARWTLFVEALVGKDDERRNRDLDLFPGLKILSYLHLHSPSTPSMCPLQILPRFSKEVDALDHTDKKRRLLEDQTPTPPADVAMVAGTLTVRLRTWE